MTEQTILFQKISRVKNAREADFLNIRDLMLRFECFKHINSAANVC